VSDAALITVRGIFEIPRLCTCDWKPPDYRYAPHRRRWKLPDPDPACRIHGETGGPR
jgi:hypothetical protein